MEELNPLFLHIIGKELTHTRSKTHFTYGILHQIQHGLISLSLIQMYLHRIFGFYANNFSLKYPRGILPMLAQNLKKKKIENMRDDEKNIIIIITNDSIWIWWTMPIHIQSKEMLIPKRISNGRISIECAFWMAGYSKSYRWNSSEIQMQ